MGKKLSDTEFTIFDLETTGLEPESGERIIEVAAFRIKGNEKLGVFQSLVSPGQRPVSPGAFAVNRITQEMLAGAPKSSEVLPEFMDFISGSCLAAYNAAFDFAFLASELRLINKTLPQELEVVDILKMAKKTLPGLERYALWFVAGSLSIAGGQEHRALSDVKLTENVFQKLVSLLDKKGIIEFEQFLGLFGISSRLLDNINSSKISRIQQALDLKVSLKIQYFSGNNAAVTEREVIPREIKQERKQDYLVGFCNLRQEERTFRIDNILHLEIGSSY
ncbi:MAG: WYL domain-containing protein [Candidatus Omnitrophica bacterium]|nr:WYL domain-containing protein [Candidatus Omnitrophota bacterium]